MMKKAAKTVKCVALWRGGSDTMAGATTPTDKSFLVLFCKKEPLFFFLLACLFCFPAAAQSLLNVSYDPTRELYQDIDRAFAKQHPSITVRTSNGGSGAQARAVLEGLTADVVTLALAYDIDALADHGLIANTWQARLPFQSTPWSSTIVFLVRKGNPKGLKDWGDLIKPGVSIITPNPKTSGGARWNYLAAYGWALHQPGGTEESARAFLRKLFQQVPVLDSGARGATNSFVQRGLGDVLLAWEDEAMLAAHDLGPDKFDIVYPPESILAEPPVAVVDKTVDRRGSRAAAEAYVQFLFSPEGQAIGAKHYFRPRDPAALIATGREFPTVRTFDIASLGGWAAVQKKHFDDGGVFDQIYKPTQ
jgi:sulfate transport system substrate-binding protein